MGTETRFQGAQTVVGTPYYISPEMCEGKPYNEKSDIWALGCILYEMACLQKTFEGTSLPALVNKIVKGTYEQIKGPYSNDLKLLVRDMLKVDPEQRPTAALALEIVQRSRSLNTKRGQKKSVHRPGSDTLRPRDCHSALYQFDIANVTLSSIAALAPKIKVKQIAVGWNHQVLLTMDSVVYSWGDNKFGQLGHGDRRTRNQPTRVEALDGKSIFHISVGTNFSAFCADRGIVMVCGNRKYTGNGKANDDWLKPKLIDCLLREDIIDLSCGYEHAAVVTDDGQVYVWGNGENGRLGTGKTDFVYSATKIGIPTRQLVINAKCGPDCTVLITSSGTIIAMGSNKYNKLNLNYRLGFFANVKHTKSEIEDILTPTAVRAFPSRVVDVSLGPNHSGVLLESGHVHLFGRNTYGELGAGNRQPASLGMDNRPVKALLCKACVQLICGNGFTMAATADNELYFWGSKGVVQRKEEIMVEDLEITRKSIATLDKGGSENSDRSKSAKKAWHWRKGGEKDDGEAETILLPTLVLRLDSTRNSSGTKPFIKLSALTCCDKNVMVVIDTSPVWVEKDEDKTKLQSAKTPRTWGRRRRSAPELHATDDSMIPTWVQNELDEAEVLSSSKFLPGSTSMTSLKSTPNEGKHLTFTQAAKLHGSSLITEKQLLTDIENLKKQLQEQKSTFKGHEDQMKLLQTKLSDLQALQRQNFERPNEPPPAYPKSSTSTNAITKNGKPRIIKNPFIPEEQQTKVCTIL
uniref:non-specific serine/threonine protein kinase n=1 Tax=Acrobeloides nanus TaxID=290746 RepID=A0A914EB19_9BILA